MSPYQPPPMDSYGRGGDAAVPPYSGGSRRRQHAGRQQHYQRGPPSHMSLASPPPLINPFGPPDARIAEAGDSYLPAHGSIESPRFQDQPVYAYIGGIDKDISDEWIEKLLGVCGRVGSWRRAVNAQDEPLSFGFCEFAGIKDAAQALHVLSSAGGIKPGGWVLPGGGSPSGAQPLTIRVDDRMLDVLEGYTMQPGNQVLASSDADAAAVESISRLISELEIAIATAKKPAEEPAGSARDPDESRDAEHQADSRGDAGTGASDDMRAFSLADEEAWEREKAELYRRRRYVLAADEREYLLGKEHMDREAKAERSALRELDRVEERQRARDTMADVLSRWDDRLEEAQRTHSYYRDRERWWHHRKAARARELESDEDDRRREEKELLRKQGSPAKRSLSPKPDSADTDAAASAAAGHSSAGQNAAVPVDGKHAVALDDLNPGVPADRTALFGWPVRWDRVDAALLRDVVEPVVRAQLVKYLGSDMEDGSVGELADFVMTHVAEHRPPADLAKELEMVLVDDTPVFVARIWKALVAGSEPALSAAS
ncbi:hypothetical protein GGI07_004132 [Coemansia sp. Benny D115]|nr:hypothetical protein GGI07_004132 [Coemansia sp. Benny D115]